jgi:hypothetical protein
MSNEIQFAWESGQTGLTANAFKPNGDARDVDISLVENATGGLYLGQASTVQIGDIIIVYQNGIYLTSYVKEDAYEKTFLKNG